jgi:acyl-coenzyme A synthetase/AMP-(fatty) acid ligase/aryl carrier-like protein
MKTLLEQIYYQINNNRDSLAIKCENQELTYQQLDDVINKTCSYLSKKTKQTDKVIPIYADRSPYVIATMLAIWKLNKAYSIIDKTTPKNRAELIFNQLKSSIVIDDDFIDSALKEKVIEFPVIKNNLNDLASVIWTSGSTGMPKGVMFSHKNHLDYVACGCEMFDDNNVLLNIVSFSFSPGQVFSFAPLSRGSLVHLVMPNRITDLKYLVQYILVNKVSVAFFPPQLASMFIVHADGVLKQLIVSSDKVSNIYSNKTKVLNVYGATEAIGISTCFEIDKLYDNTPIGKPFSLVNIYLLDDNDEMVKNGEIGEICISGNIALGYFDDLKLTEEKFRKNPFSKSDDDKKIYHTGDLAYKNENDDLVYIQRKDFMINIHGQRVEPSEVEEAIKKLSDIQNVVVGGFNADKKTGIENDVQLYAGYISNKELGTSNLQKELEDYLPKFMIPAIFQRINNVPLNDRGKIDRKNIIPENILDLYKDNNPSSNLNTKEKEVQVTVKEILKEETVGLNTNLISLGLHSLMAIELSAVLNKQGFIISAQDILRNPTIKEISKNLKKIDETTKTHEKQEYYPLKKNQIGLYLYMIQHKNSTAYNIPFLIEFTKDINIKKLITSIEKTINHFPYIKSTLIEKDGIPYLKRNDKTKVKINICENLDENKLVKPYPIYESNLYRISIHKTKNTVYLFLDFNHMVFDGGSVNVFFNKIIEIFNDKEIVGIEELAFDSNLNEEKYLNNKEHKDYMIKFYNSMLNNINSATDILSSVTNIKNKNQSDEIILNINKTNIKSFAKENNFTINNLFLFVYVCVLKLFSNSNNILLSIEINTRENKYLNPVGMYVSTLPLLIEVNEKDSLNDFIKKIENLLLKAEENNQYSLIDMQQDYGFIPKLSYNFRVGLFNKKQLINSLDEVKDAYHLLDKTKDVKFPFILQIDDDEENYILIFQYDSNIYDKDLVKSFAEAMENFLNKLVNMT